MHGGRRKVVPCWMKVGDDKELGQLDNVGHEGRKAIGLRKANGPLVCCEKKRENGWAVKKLWAKFGK
jgi:hypothetical protein